MTRDALSHGSLVAVKFSCPTRGKDASRSLGRALCVFPLIAGRKTLDFLILILSQVNRFAGSGTGIDDRFHWLIWHLKSVFYQATMGLRWGSR